MASCGGQPENCPAGLAYQLRVKRGTGLRAAAIVTAAGAICLAQATAPPAAMFRSDARHSGVSDTAAGPALEGVLWSFATAGPVRGSPVIAGDAILLGSGDGFLYCLDASTGRQRWRTDLGGPVPSAPAVSGGLVFATSRNLRVTALDLATGAVRWRFDTGPEMSFGWGWDYFLSSPTVSGGAVYVGAGDGNLYALGAQTGKERWRVATSGRVRSSPAVVDGTVYFGSRDGRLYALDAETGRNRWSFDTEGHSIDLSRAGYDRTSIDSSPAVSEELVFFGSRDGHLYAVDRWTGKQRWRFGHRVGWMSGAPEVSWVIGSPALYEGLVLVGSSDGRFFNAVRAPDGGEVWRFETPLNVLSSGTVAAGSVFFGCSEGHLFALDAKSGRELWRFRTGGPVLSTPAVRDGVVYVGSDDGLLYALKTGPEKPRRSRRAVFWKDPGKAKWFQGDVDVRDYFAGEGYEVVDDAGLLRFLADTTAASRSTVVMASDLLPSSVAASPAEESLLRRYLVAGGRMVWLGMAPDGFVLDEQSGKPLGVDLARPGKLLGVSHDGAFVGDLGVRATAEGRRWGLPEWWVGGLSVPADQVTTVLGRDEYGRAAAWLKNFGGMPDAGFVRVWGREGRIADVSWVKAIAEHAE
jgi:eukaryotic-like serine/threonine-protein kinase